MKTTLLSLSLLLLAVTSGLTLTAGCTARAVEHGAPDAARGRYLVEQVAMCQDCHSPRDEQGRFVPERWLMGSQLPFTPTVPMPWAPVSKPIAGLPGFDDAQAIAFLTTGAMPDGRRLLPPMPEYRFSEQDARDVLAYLRKPVAPTMPAAEGAR